MVPGSQDILSQRICSFTTIIKQHFAYWVVNNVSFRPENKDFTWKPNPVEEMQVYIYMPISLRGKGVLAKTIYTEYQAKQQSSGNVKIFWEINLTVQI